MKKLFPLLIISFLAWLPTTDAQLTISGEDAVVCDNGTVSIDISVSNFIDISSAQFGITWDPAVVQFTSVSNNMPASALYNTVNAPTGELRFSWFDANPPPGYTPAGPPAGSQIIFTINFNVVGDYTTNDFTTITFGSVPGFSMEIASTSGIIPNGNIIIDPGTVTLDDNTPPAITCPANVTVTAAIGQSFANVNYAAPLVTDNCDAPAAPAVCNPVSGSAFAIGTATVNCTATDGAGNSANCSFSVTVNPPPANPNALIVEADDFAIICNDTVVNVPVRVENFTQMTSAQFALVWDELVLDYTGYTDSINATGHSTALYNFTNASTGEFRFSWFDADGIPGENLADSTVIFTLHFKVLDENQLPDTVVITGVPGYNIEFSDTSGVFGPGDYAFADAIVSVVPDTIAPSITCPPTQTLVADTNCEAMLPDYTSMATATDNCSDPMDIVITQTPAAGTVVTDTTEVMLIATDEVGLMDTCFFDVNFVDTLLPTIICPANDTLDVDSAACFATIMLPAATATDNCGIASITDDGPMGGEFPVGTTTVTFTATDVNGNVATCQLDVLVNDTLPPVITCPADIMQANDVGDCSAVVTWAMPTVVDNCSNVTITCIPPSGTVFPVGDSTVVCIVEDPGGNTDTCTFLVTVFDDEPVTMTCVSDTTILVPAGTVDTIVENIYIFALSDNCSLDTLYYTLTGALTGDGDGVDVSGTSFPVGTTTITYYGVDDVGNIGSCSFDVNIQEDVLLAITCSPSQTVDNDPGICTATVANVTADAQPSGGVTSSFYETTGATVGSDTLLDASGVYNGGVTTITFYAVSTLGDTVSCSTTVTVNDTELSVFTNCPSDTITMNTSLTECGIVFSGSIVPVATDNCPNVDLSYNFDVDSLVPIGYNTVVATAMDMSGNSTTCTYVLEVVDNQAPTFTNCTNGTSISRVTDPDECGAVVLFSPVVGALDNCSLLAFTETSPGNGDFFPTGTTIITYTAVDNVGNVSTCEILVTVTDAQPPTLICPSNIPPVNTDLNMCSAVVNFVAPTADDNCSVVSFGPTTPVGPVFPAGVSTVNYEATDAAGNVTTCTFTVTVVDNQFPFIPNMPADITVYTNANDCGANVFWTPPSPAIDNCGIDTYGPSGGNPGDFFAVGTSVVKYVAMDIHGNITVEDLNITVLDTLPPAITCPAGISVSVDGATLDDPDGLLTSVQQVDCDNIQLDYTALMASDACGVASITQTAGLPSGGAFPIGTTIMSFEATDNYGNTSVCSFAINVLDYQITPPTATPGLVCEGGTVTFNVGTLPGAIYTWSNGGNVVSTQPTFVIADAALNQSGIYTLVVSTAYCDLTFTTELNVSPVPVVTIDADDVQCTTSGLPLVLTGQNSSTANVTNWTWTFPNGSMPTGQIQTVPNPTTSNSGTYCVTATSLFGCTASACEQITVSNGPPTPAVFGDVSALCLGDDVTITNATLFSGSSITYNWSATPQAGSGLLQSINNPIIKPKPTAAGTYTYKLFVEVDGCVSDTAEWVVVVGAAPTIDLQVSGETQCVDGGSDITLTDNGTGAVNWVWTGPIPLPPVNTNSVVLQNVTPIYSGTYTVVATDSIGCTSSASTTLTITATPAAPQLTTSSFSICDGDTVTLIGTQYNAPVTYIWSGPGVPPNSQNFNQIDVTPPNGPGNYIYSFAAFTNNGCYTDTVSVTVSVTASPVLAIDVVGETTCVDGTTSITLSTVTAGLTNIEWTDALGNVLASTNPYVLTNVTSDDSGDIFLSATSQGCTGYGSTTLDISDGIDGLTAISSMADCASETITLESNAIANASYSWFGPNTQLVAITQNTTVSNAADGTYTVVAQANGCSDTATVEVNLPNILDANDKIVRCTVDVAQDFNILAMDVYEPGQPFTITILQEATNGVVTYHENDSIYTYTPNPGYWGSDFIIYQICYTECPDFCSTAKVTFDINQDPKVCVITTVISPNDDGINDEFVVSCVANDGYPLNTLYIYNQWGDKVYEAAPYKNDWKGTYEGKDLPDGTYFFIFQRDPDTPAQKGFVMIYR